MRLINLLSLLFVLTIFKVSGQQNFTVPDQKANNLPNLSLGEALPDFTINKLINTDKKTASTNEYKDQLLIIDFWATNCSGCVEALPKMDALQKQFSLKVKILPVTYEKEAEVITFWKNNKYTKNLSLPSVVEDETFTGYFKHLSIPHEVWVYNGKVIGITSSDYVDANNIQLVLNGQQVNWPVKNDFYTFTGLKEPLFTFNRNLTDTGSTFIKYVAISHYKEGVNPNDSYTTYIIRNREKKMVRTYFQNSSIYTAYVLNWNYVSNIANFVKPSFQIQPNQIIWEVQNKSKYIFNEGNGYRQDWFRKNGICYESLNPDSGLTDIEIHQSVIDNLDQQLGLHARWEKRKEKVLLLVRTDKTKILKSKHTLTNQYDDRLVIRGLLHQFRDLTLSVIAWQMNEQAENPYVFDETNYAEKVDLDLKFSSWTDIAGIRRALQNYGLDLKEEERLVDKFVFTEINRRYKNRTL